jgi:hypothetical protein
MNQEQGLEITDPLFATLPPPEHDPEEEMADALWEVERFEEVKRNQAVKHATLDRTIA